MMIFGIDSQTFESHALAIPLSDVYVREPARTTALRFAALDTLEVKQTWQSVVLDR